MADDIDSILDELVTDSKTRYSGGKQHAKADLESLIAKHIKAELKDIMRQGNFNDTVPSFILNNRIQHYKQLEAAQGEKGK